MADGLGYVSSLSASASPSHIIENFDDSEVLTTVPEVPNRHTTDLI